MKLIFDNQATLHVSFNSIFHGRTKHIEIDYYFIKEKIALRCMTTSFINSNDELTDIFTNSLGGLKIKYIFDKFDTFDLYTPT